MIYCLSDFDDIFIPALYRIGAYSFGLCVCPCVSFFVHSSVHLCLFVCLSVPLRIVNATAMNSFLQALWDLLSCMFNVVIICEYSGIMSFGHRKLLF